MTSATIRNCFRRAGISKDVLFEGIDAPVEDENDEENLPISLWLERNGVNIFPKDISENFESFDDDVCTSGTPTYDDIVSEVNKKKTMS